MSLVFSRLILHFSLRMLYKSDVQGLSARKLVHKVSAPGVQAIQIPGPGA